MVHRLLGVACGAYDSSPELIEMQKTQKLCQHMNYRHKMAQEAGRASVALHTQVSNSVIIFNKLSKDQWN